MSKAATLQKLSDLQAELAGLGADLAAQTVADAATYARAFFDREPTHAQSKTTGYAPTIVQEA